MSRDVEPQAEPLHSSEDIIGINWGSSNFRAYRIDAQGSKVDEFSKAAGVASLGRSGMVDVMRELQELWPVPAARVYASGMVGSNIGWAEAPYVRAPARLDELRRGLVPVVIGETEVHIVPGVSCRRNFDEGPDVMRGEEMELFGFAATHPEWNGLIALPGTHTKWARFSAGRIVDFFTSMSGEIFDRLTAAGLLASIVDGPAVDGPAFREGVLTGRRRHLGLSTTLFGARARVMHGKLDRSDAASYLRGLLIGSEIADALAIHPGLQRAPLPLVGSSPLCKLYAGALESAGMAGVVVESGEACVSGFANLHAASDVV